MIDLHTHSTASDGTFSPSRLIAQAENVGLHALALTDHDTVDGLEEALRASKNARVLFVPGVELSARVDRGSLHIVGLCIDPWDAHMRRVLRDLVEMRNARNAKIIKKLNELGIDVTLDDVAKKAGGHVLGRPHFAAVLIEKGLAKSPADAFGRYLSPKGSAYVQKERLEKRQAIELIRRAGGLPVLAHPNQTMLDGPDLEKLVKELADLGLEGIEAYYSGYSPPQVKRYRRLGEKYNLVLSGGSDFHGDAKKAIALGTGPGSLRVPDELLEPIFERAKGLVDLRGGRDSRDQRDSRDKRDLRD